MLFRSIHHHATTIENDDAIHPLQHLHAVRCDDQGARRKPRRECVNHLVFRHFIEVRGRLVEQQHRGLPHHRARQQQRLTLSTRQAEPPS